ncbi:MAG TPA: class I SAM-dependent methyltransferase [Actinobacteria bacterium]|nr:class I SAM-dependent methyltransferase [Actinomycetota bacterium]
MNAQPQRPQGSFNSDIKTSFFQAKYIDLFQRGESVLDIGCGSGVFMELLRGKGVLPIGVDESDEAYKTCRDKGLFIHRDHAFSFLAKNKNTYNGIFASHFIEHFSPKDVLRLFELGYEALKPGGVMAVVTPNTADLVVMTQWFWLDPTHVRPYPKDLVMSLMGQSNFTIVTAGEDKQSVGVRGIKQRTVDTIRRITTLGLAGRGDIFVAGRKKKD